MKIATQACLEHHEVDRQVSPPHRTVSWALLGLLVALAVPGGVGLWAATTNIDGAVLAKAQVVVETDRKTVQHLEGGIVREILVKEGDLVQAGDLLFRLDATQDESAMIALQDRLADLAARRARLHADLAGSEAIAWPVSVESRAKEPRIAAVLAAQEQLFTSRRAARESDLAFFAKRSAALRARIDALRQQSAALRKELALTAEEDAVLTELDAKRLATLSQVLEVRRNLARVRSRLAAQSGEISSLEAQIEEVAAQRARGEARFRQETAVDLSGVQAEIAQLEERRTALRDRLARREVRAPQTGRVFNLAVHTRGGVVASGAPLMEIVPLHDDLVLRARVPASEVERVAPGSRATVRLVAFNHNTTPELTGTVETISADAKVDADSGDSFYAASVRLGAQELARLGGKALTPGMPAQVLIRTGERLAASYFLRPLADSYARAFRDE